MVLVTVMAIQTRVVVVVKPGLQAGIIPVVQL